MLKLLGTTVQNLVALRPGAGELCSPFRRICRTVIQGIKAAFRNCNIICTYVLVVVCLPQQVYGHDTMTWSPHTFFFSDEAHRRKVNPNTGLVLVSLYLNWVAAQMICFSTFELK